MVNPIAKGDSILCLEFCRIRAILGPTMKNLTLGWIALVMGLVAATDARSAELGMQAPPIQIAEWVKGGPVAVDGGKGTNLYVVEFWATWCPPCRASIPHLSDLQERFKDKGVVVVGISDEEPGKVKPFVKEMGNKMSYVVAIDKTNASSEAYMKAFGQNGIPHAFVVDRAGRVAWHGHPMDGLDQALEQMVAGKYDIESARRSALARDRMIEYFEMSSEDTLSPQAAKLGAEVVDGLSNDPQALNNLAWVILTHDRIKHRDLPLALRAAKSAYDTTSGKDAAVADTYARALFDSGKKDEAIRVQKKAIEACTNDEMRQELERNLKTFEASTK
jgi:thiol-disulfide isomerase/thioredoxin